MTVLAGPTPAAVFGHRGSLRPVRQQQSGELDPDGFHYVTHLYELAAGLHRDRPDALFLRARRRTSADANFKVLPGEPLTTSHGADIYHRVLANTGGKS